MTNKISLRTAAVLLISGTILNVASNVVQPAISDYSYTLEVFTAIAAEPLWKVSRVGLLFASVLGASGVILFYLTIRGERGQIPALLGAAFSLVGVAVTAIMMAFDIAQFELALRLLESASIQAGPALWTGHALHAASFATFSITLIIAGGLTPLLIGLALILGVGYPKWIGWLSFVGGSGVMVTAAMQAVKGPASLSIGVLIPLFGVMAVIAYVALSIVLWRK